MDCQTAHAFSILAKHVKSSPDRRLARALDRVRQQLDREAAPLPRAETSTTRAADQPDDPWQADDLMLSDDVLESAITAGTADRTGDRLRNCRPAVPLPRQAQIVDEVLRAARRAGLSLPPTMRIEWREGREDITSGCVITDTGGAITMYLTVNISPDALREVAFHETMHVHDAASGTSRTRLELERRAIAFAARMMGWQ